VVNDSFYEAGQWEKRQRDLRGQGLNLDRKMTITLSLSLSLSLSLCISHTHIYWHTCTRTFYLLAQALARFLSIFLSPSSSKKKFCGWDWITNPLSYADTDALNVGCSHPQIPFIANIQKVENEWFSLLLSSQSISISSISWSLFIYVC